MQATRVARARVAREPEFDGITFAQYLLLDAVDQVGSDGSARVAEVAGVAGATATQALARLETKGLVRRRRDPGDGRVVTASLSGEGRRLVDEKRAFLSQRTQALFRSLESDHRRRATELLDELADLIEAI
jgi:DNA-binding MarR family transcriptional regulator